MPLIRPVVAGEKCKIFVLPPADPKYYARFHQQFARSDSIFGFDVETTSTDDELGMFAPDAKLRLVQFGSKNEAWCLDPNEPMWRNCIHAMISHPRRRFVSHTNYDPLWMEREFNFPVDERWIDTYPMAALLWPGQTAPKDLKALSDRWIDDGLTKAQAAMHARFKELAPKGQRVGKKLANWGFTNIPLNDPFYGTYGGLDAIYVRRLLDILNKLLRKEHMSKLSRREQHIARLATRMQIRGQRLDLPYVEKLLSEIEQEYNNADEYLSETFGFSPRSPRRGEWLEDRKIIVRERTPSGRPKLDKETIPNLIAANRSSKFLPVLEAMQALSSNQNLLNNLRQLRNSADADGFVHPRINTQAALTGRMSIVRPAMQTFKKRDLRLRGCFIAREGHVFVGADYDNQETRIAAAFSGDETLRRVVFEGLNQHLLTTEMIFDVHDKETMNPNTPGQSYYDIAKILDFAQQYGAGPKKIAIQLGISVAEAKELWLSWRKTYAGLVAWSDSVAQYSHVVNPWGRVIPADKFRRYANGNYAIQSSGRDILGDAMVKLDQAGWGSHIWLPIHDELILEVPESEADYAVKELEQAMFAQLGDVPITASAKIIGHRWNGED